MFLVFLQVKVSLLNFTITIKGLEEQLLNTAVKEELPDLASKKVMLLIHRAHAGDSIETYRGGGNVPRDRP